VTKEEEEPKAIQSMLERIPRLISKEDNIELDKEIKEEEVINVIWGLELYKVPNPDGFSIYFYHACWSLTKHYLCHMLR
jgi:hypothetical protein